MKELPINSNSKFSYEWNVTQLDYSEEKKQKIRQLVSELKGVKIGNVEVVPKIKSIDEFGNNVSLTNDVIKNIQEPSFQLQLFKEYLNLNQISVDFEEIKKIDEYVNSFIDFDNYTKHKTYKFKYVKWDNYLSYGSNNYFSFEDLKGLVLVNGKPENQCGKTTFSHDLILFALFGKSPKAPTLDSVFNLHLPQETTCKVELCLVIEDETYVIRRTVTRPALSKRTSKSKCKQTVEYYRVVNGVEELINNLEGESTTETNTIIKDTINNIEDFSISTIANSYTLSDILRYGQTDLGRLFSRWLGLLSLEDKEKVAKDKWKNAISKELLSSKLSLLELQNELNAIEVLIKDCETKKVQHTKTKDELVKTIELDTNKYQELISKQRPISEDIKNLNITQIQKDIQIKSEEFERVQGIFDNKKAQYLEIKHIVYNEDRHKELETKKVELEQNYNSTDKSMVEKRVLFEQLKSRRKELEDLISKEVCPTCKQNVNNSTHGHYFDAFEEKSNEIIKEGLTLKENLKTIKEEIEKVDLELKELLTIKEVVNTRSKLELELTALKSQKDGIKAIIELKENQIKQIKLNEENIKFNDEIQVQLNLLKGTINSNTIARDYQTNTIATIEADLKRFQKDKEKNNELRVKLEEEERIVRNWKIYQELIGKNGVVKLVLKKALPVINCEISRLLNGLCDFEVSVTMDEENKLILNMFQDGTPMPLSTCGSGFESTMSALAIRTALSSVGCISVSNFLVLDEIVGTIGSENIENLHQLFRRMLGNRYDLILHITHNDSLAHIHDSVVTVSKNDKNISSLVLKK